MVDSEEFRKTAERIWQRAKKEGRLIDNPTEEELRELVTKEPGIKKTIYDNFVAESEPTSRSAMFSKNSIDSPFGEEELGLLTQCEKILAKNKLICLDRIVGREDSEITVRLITPKKFAHIAYGGKNLFLPPKKKVKKPTHQVLFFFDRYFESNKSKPPSQKDITIRLAMLKDGRFVKIIKNSNYIGEYKKGVFAAQDWFAKIKQKGIFLHAGCREDYLQSVRGKYQKVRTLLIALSANGKTTLTSKIIARKGREKSWLVQDDGGTLKPDGSFSGFEAGGIFVKTEGVNPDAQAEIYYGLLKPETFLENVYVDKNSDFDFYNYEKTSNGRAIIKRKDLLHASPYIDVEKVDNLILITRGPLIPAIAKLTLEQTTALMILGQAMESSAGDPDQAGKIRSEFFYDPFMAGDKAKHANLFYKILKGLPYKIDCYLINTGGIGEGPIYKDIKLEYTLGILDSLLRGGLKDWVSSPSGFQVPKAIRTVDEIYLHPEKLYSKTKFAEKQKELNKIRVEAIERIGGKLNSRIKDVLKK